jgi:hypothetical protein
MNQSNLRNFPASAKHPERAGTDDVDRFSDAKPTTPRLALTGQLVGAGDRVRPRPRRVEWAGQLLAAGQASSGRTRPGSDQARLPVRCGDRRRTPRRAPKSGLGGGRRHLEVRSAAAGVAGGPDAPAVGYQGSGQGLLIARVRELFRLLFLVYADGGSHASCVGRHRVLTVLPYGDHRGGDRLGGWR